MPFASAAPAGLVTLVSLPVTRMSSIVACPSNSSAPPAAKPQHENTSALDPSVAVRLFWLAVLSLMVIVLPPQSQSPGVEDFRLAVEVVRRDGVVVDVTVRDRE